MDLRKLTKSAAKIVAVNAVGYVATKTILSVLPKAGKFKMAAMAGELIGGAIVGRFEDKIDELVDSFFETRVEAKIEYPESA